MATSPDLPNKVNPLKSFASFVMWNSVRFCGMFQLGGCPSIQPSPGLCKTGLISGLISSAWVKCPRQIKTLLKLSEASTEEDANDLVLQ